jgi:hypothetical protein
MKVDEVKRLMERLYPVQEILFKGSRYWMFSSGAIATPRNFPHPRSSYAHLFPDGSIMRYGEVIGSESDIERLGPVDPNEWESKTEGANDDQQNRG